MADPAPFRRLFPVGQFMVSFGKRVPDMPPYALFLIPLFAVMAVRLAAMASAKSARAAPAA